MFPEVWNTVYCPKNLDTKNMKLLLEIEQMFNDKFGGQPKWEFDEEKGMYKTLFFLVQYYQFFLQMMQNIMH